MRHRTLKRLRGLSPRQRREIYADGKLVNEMSAQFAMARARSRRVLVTVGDGSGIKFTDCTFSNN